MGRGNRGKAQASVSLRGKFFSKEKQFTFTPEYLLEELNKGEYPYKHKSGRVSEEPYAAKRFMQQEFAELNEDQTERFKKEISEAYVTGSQEEKEKLTRALVEVDPRLDNLGLSDYGVSNSAGRALFSSNQKRSNPSGFKKDGTAKAFATALKEDFIVQGLENPAAAAEHVDKAIQIAPSVFELQYHVARQLLENGVEGDVEQIASDYYNQASSKRVYKMADRFVEAAREVRDSSPDELTPQAASEKLAKAAIDEDIVDYWGADEPALAIDQIKPDYNEWREWQQRPVEEDVPEALRLNNELNPDNWILRLSQATGASEDHIARMTERAAS
jgi:hypothetical protein